MTLSGFDKDVILHILAWRPIAVAAMASAMMSLSVGRNGNKPICILVWQLTKVAARTNVLEFEMYEDCLFGYLKDPFGELSMYTTRLLLKMQAAFTIIKTKNEETVEENAAGTMVATAQFNWTFNAVQSAHDYSNLLVHHT
nr:hypothetical protein [Tanacetum cinerariifolium]